MDVPIVVTEPFDVAPGHEADFYSWGTALIEVIARGGGYLGGEVRDPEWADGDWRLVHRWAAGEVAREWEASPTRARWLRAAEPFARPRPPREHPARPPATRPAEPRETPPAPAPAAPPPKWKMAVVTLTAVFPPVLFFNVALIPRLTGVTVVLRTLILCVGVTVVVTWIMMPRLMPLFRGWLHPTAGSRRQFGGGPAPAESDPDPTLDPESAVERFPRFRPATEPISDRGVRTTRPGARTMTLDPTDPYPRRYR